MGYFEFFLIQERIGCRTNGEFHDFNLLLFFCKFCLFVQIFFKLYIVHLLFKENIFFNLFIYKYALTTTISTECSLLLLAMKIIENFQNKFLGRVVKEVKSFDNKHLFCFANLKSCFKNKALLLFLKSKIYCIKQISNFQLCELMFCYVNRIEIRSMQDFDVFIKSLILKQIPNYISQIEAEIIRCRDSETRRQTDMIMTFFDISGNLEDRSFQRDAGYGNIMGVKRVFSHHSPANAAAHKRMFRCRRMRRLKKKSRRAFDTVLNAVICV